MLRPFDRLPSTGSGPRLLTMRAEFAAASVLARIPDEDPGLRIRARHSSRACALSSLPKGEEPYRGEASSGIPVHRGRFLPEEPLSAVRAVVAFRTQSRCVSPKAKCPNPKGQLPWVSPAQIWHGTAFVVARLDSEEKHMFAKATIAVVAAAAIFGAISAAQAGGRDDGTAGEATSTYGSRIGPLGQPLGGPMAWRGRPTSIYAYVPRARLNRNWIYEYSRGD